MKKLDIVVFVVFVAALIVLCFFQNCALDIVFLVLGFGVAALCGVTMIWMSKRKKDNGISSDE